MRYTSRTRVSYLHLVPEMVSVTSLSDLPDDAIHQILHRLPARDAARTSILSRSWRCRWRSIPDLDLLFPTAVPAAAVSQILLHHSAPIRLFKAYHSGEDDPTLVRAWLFALAGPTLRALTLCVPFSSVKIGPLHFPNLTELDLSGFHLPDPTRSTCFASLRTLRLHNIGHCSNQISNLISSCPLLETLTLRRVHIVGQVEIVAPRLRRLELGGACVGSGVCFESGLVVSSLPALEVALLGDVSWEFRDHAEDGIPNMVKFLGSMASVKMLRMSRGLVAFLLKDGIPERMPIRFDHLRVIAFGLDFANEKAVCFALCLLRSAPNLEELEIEGGLYCKDPFRQDFWEVQQRVDQLDKLKIVKMTNILCIKAEFDFMQFVLAKTGELQTMMIGFHRDIKYKELVMRFITELFMFWSVSNQAQIIFT